MGTKVIIAAMGHYHPENRIENSFFDQLGIDSDSEWVTDRTGILYRHSILTKDDILKLREGTETLESLRVKGKIMPLASMAGKAWSVLKGRQGQPDLEASLDALICGTSVPDFDIPANACTIAAEIGVQCPAFDVNSACSSFVTDLHVAASLIKSGSHKAVSIFNPERYSVRMNYADKRTCILFGDGCSVAMVTSNEEEAVGGLEVIDLLLESDPAKFDLVKIPDSGLFDQNGKAVQKFAISKTIEVTKSILERNSLTPSDISYFAGHQANLRMVTSAADRLGIPEERHLYNVDQFGNQGAAGGPAVLSMNWGRFKKGELIVLSVVGSGLSWGSVLLRKV